MQYKAMKETEGKKLKLNKEKFYAIKKRPNGLIVGDVDLRGKTDEEPEGTVEISGQTTNVYRDGSVKGKTVGYLYVNEEKADAEKHTQCIRLIGRRSIVPFIIIGAIALILLLLCLIKVPDGDTKRTPMGILIAKIGSLFEIDDIDVPLGDLDIDGLPSGTPDFDIPELDEGSDWDGTLPTAGEDSKANTESIMIPGYADLVLSDATPSVQLINPTGNTVYMVYTITNNGEEIYKTKGVVPGKFVVCNLKELLEPGVYNLRFSIATYDVETYEPCNGANMDVKTTIK